MNWPEAVAASAAILGPCLVVSAMMLAKPKKAEREAPKQKEEREKLPGLRAPGEYYIAYTPARCGRSRRNWKRKGGQS